MSAKLNIFQFLGMLNKRDRHTYSRLSEAEQKQAHPLVVMRWMSGSNKAQQLMMLNTIANPFIFSLYQDKELLMQLLAICGERSKPTWIKGPSVKNKTKQPITVRLLCEAFNYSNRRALETLEFIDGEWAIDLANQHGWQDKQIAELAKEWGVKGYKAPKGSSTPRAKKTTDKVADTNQQSGVEDAVEF